MLLSWARQDPETWAQGRETGRARAGGGERKVLNEANCTHLGLLPGAEKIEGESVGAAVETTGWIMGLHSGTAALCEDVWNTLLLYLLKQIQICFGVNCKIQVAILKRKNQEAPTSNVTLTVDLLGGDLDSDFLGSVTSPAPASEHHCTTWKSSWASRIWN